MHLNAGVVEVTARRQATIHETPFISSGEGETNSSNSHTLYLMYTNGKLNIRCLKTYLPFHPSEKAAWLVRKAASPPWKKSMHG
jgi:hypothetical protein